MAVVVVGLEGDAGRGALDGEGQERVGGVVVGGAEGGVGAGGDGGGRGVAEADDGDACGGDVAPGGGREPDVGEVVPVAGGVHGVLEVAGGLVGAVQVGDDAIIGRGHCEIYLELAIHNCDASYCCGVIVEDHEVIVGAIGPLAGLA